MCCDCDQKREHQKVYRSIIYYVLKSIIYFQKRRESMSKSHLLCENYSQWLKMRGRVDEQQIVNNLRGLAHSFYNPEFNKDNKSIYPSLHVHFLIHSLTAREDHVKLTFPLIITTLNYIFKGKCSIRIALTSQLIQAISTCLEEDGWGKASPVVVSNVLWFLCKCLQGSQEKKAALRELAKSGLVFGLLEKGELDGVAEKAISMLLYYISKNQTDKHYIASLILQHSNKFHQVDSLKHVLAILEEAGVQKYEQDAATLGLLQQFMVRYMGMEEVSLSSKMEHLGLICFTVLKNPTLAHALRIREIIECKLSITIQSEQPRLDELIKLIDLQVLDENSMQRYLDLSASTLTNNIISRRVFILFHEKMSELQLISSLSQGLPSLLLRLLNCPREVQNGLKLLICLKRSVNRFGLNRVFWYSCKSLIERILGIRRESLSQSSLQLLQLFEEIMHEEIEVINNI